MSIDTTTASAARPKSTDLPAGKNRTVVRAILEHHAALAAHLNGRTDAVVDAAWHGGGEIERDGLCQWYRDELIPHVMAEERVLYAAGRQLEVTRLLVAGMTQEHRVLVSLIADLGVAGSAVEIAAAASAAREVFALHLTKENDLLLPALDRAQLNLGEMLAGLHEILGRDEEQATDQAACGCGCGCSDESSGQADEPVAPPVGDRPTLGLVSAHAGAVVDESAAADATLTDGSLDVRQLPHGARHEIIFARLEGLRHGEAMVIVNDHDPKPLRTQAETLWPGRYTWSYLESGPRDWRLQIRRTA